MAEEKQSSYVVLLNEIIQQNKYNNIISFYRNTESFNYLSTSLSDATGWMEYEKSEHYAMGQGVPRNTDMRIRHLQASLCCNNVQAIMKLVLHHTSGEGNGRSDEENEKLAFLLCSKAAELNHPEAMHDIAMAYKDGTGVEKNVVTSVRWLMKASKFQHKRSISLLNISPYYEVFKLVEENDALKILTECKKLDWGSIVGQEIKSNLISSDDQAGY